MHQAPLASTIVAIALLPIAVLFVHAYLSGCRHGQFHRVTGLAAIAGDLSLSIGYMIYRSLGGKAGGASLHLQGGLMAYFILHGMISLVVIILEVAILIGALASWKRGTMPPGHGAWGRILFYTWWFAFLSGELFYIVYYVLSKNHP